MANNEGHLGLLKKSKSKKKTKNCLVWHFVNIVCNLNKTKNLTQQQLQVTS